MKDTATLLAKLVEHLAVETADMPAKRTAAHIARSLVGTDWLTANSHPSYVDV